MAFKHWFLPHPDTHQKAHLLSLQALFIYILIFVFLQVWTTTIGYMYPGVLGTSSNVDQKRLIELTNQERQKMGLPPLTENSALNNAAAAKAANMFSENYWAHFAPSGKSPWDFISGSGYKFKYAGENLAKNFYNSEDVVIAWMNSPTHKDNIINSRYQEIGIAVVDGVLDGQKTTLVVQMFGTKPSANLANIPEPSPVINISGKQIEVTQEKLQNVAGIVPELNAQAFRSSAAIQPLIDPFQTYKAFGLAIIFFISGLLLLDFIVLQRRGVFRISGHHLAHMALLSTTAISVLNATPGSIL